MQRYNASHGDTLIFNYNYGSSYGCCNTGWFGGGLFGGGWFGGGCCAPRNFWSGLGAGIGHGLANALGGFLGGFMNMPFGWSSFGMPFLGSGFGTPIFNNYGMVPNYVNLFTPTLTPANTGSKPSSTTTSSTDNNSTSSTTGTNGATGNTNGATGNTNGATGNTNGATGNTNGTAGNTNGTAGNTNGATGNSGAANGAGSGANGTGASSGASNSTVEELTARAGKIDENSSYDDIDELMQDMQNKSKESGLPDADKQKLESRIGDLEPKKAAALVKECIEGSKPLDLTNTQYLIKNLDKLDDTSKKELQIKLQKVDLADLKNSAKNNNYFVSNKPEKMYQLYLLSELTGKTISLTVENFAKGDDPSITGTFESIEPNDDGYINFVIDCKDTGKVGAKWTLSQISETECKPIKAVREKEDGSGEEEFELNDVKYTWDSTKKCWCNKTNTSSIKDYQRVKKQE